MTTEDRRFTLEEVLTIESYNQHAEQWAEEHATPGFWGEEMVAFQRLIPKGRILEVGCGGGRDAKELIAAGYDYLGTDISSGLLKEAQLNNPTGKFLEKSVYDLDFIFNREFDGFWASAVLLHLPKACIDTALEAIFRSIKLNGIGFISIKQGEGEGVYLDYLNDGTPIARFWAFYTQEEFANILNLNHFHILSSNTKPISRKTTRLTYFVQSISP